MEGFLSLNLILFGLVLDFDYRALCQPERMADASIMEYGTLLPFEGVPSRLGVNE